MTNDLCWRDRERAARRFFAKVVPAPADECWLWTASVQKPQGYARFRNEQGATMLAHRWLYELLIAEIPDGLQLDHLCRVRHCVNPWHLEPVTALVNTRRGHSPPALRRDRTSCAHGHEFTPENTRITIAKNGTPLRHCRACGRERMARAKSAADGDFRCPYCEFAYRTRKGLAAHLRVHRAGRAA